MVPFKKVPERGLFDITRPSVNTKRATHSACMEHGRKVLFDNMCRFKVLKPLLANSSFSPHDFGKFIYSIFPNSALAHLLVFQS